MDSITFSLSANSQVRIKKSNGTFDPTQAGDFTSVQLGYNTKGTDAGQIDVLWMQSFELAKSGAKTFSLDDVSYNPLDNDGSAGTGEVLVVVTGVLVRMVANADDSTMSDLVTMETTTADPSPFIWTTPSGGLDEGTGVKIPKGGFFAWGSDEGVDLTGEPGGIRFLNQDSANKATIEMTIIGRSA